MLVTFTTDAYANITMFGDDALSMLKMMGHSATIPSAILAADVPHALSLLTAAVDAAKAANPSQSLVQDKDKDADDSSVSVVKRALPLIELLTAAARKNCNVMWH
ncbi:MAG TPA: DUF1840 domain-containing protein [Gallionella sp.]|jgi:hypothetical protein